MECRNYETPFGEVPIWGHLDQFSPNRRLLVVIRGAFADFDHLGSLIPTLPHLDVALLHLPGMHSPFLREPSIQAFGLAFGSALHQAFRDRQINFLGASMGGLAALAVRGPPVRSIIALDTPLTTLGLWPMHQGLRRLAREDPRLANWISRIFGVSPCEIVQRDYRWLLDDLQTPTRVLIGAERLEPVRHIPRMPSLVAAEDRALYLAHPSVGVTDVADTGHNIPRDAPGPMYDVIYRWLGKPAGAVS